MQFPCVLLQIEVPAEALSADAASERLPFVVCVHMKRQIVYLVESFVANTALVRLLAAVSQTVVLVVALLVEALAAEFADERFVSGVYSRVSIQRR